MFAVVRVLALVLPAVVALSTAARAEEPVVVELFTSQGCSSCAPADRLLAQLANRADVIALSLHVDYWDYLGWRDTFAKPKFTKRQYAYRDAWNKNVIYTPQIVVHGRRAVPATDVQAVDAAIKQAESAPAPIDISIRPENGMLKCRIAPGHNPEPGTIWIAKYTLSATVDIKRGENAGRTMTYRNVVNSLMRMGKWSGSAVQEVEMPQPDPGEGVAVWVQNGKAGPIQGAAKLDNPAP